MLIRETTIVLLSFPYVMFYHYLLVSPCKRLFLLPEQKLMKKRTVLLIISLVLFLLSAVLLTLVIYGLTGALPKSMKEAARIQQSISQYEEVEPEPLLGNVYNRETISLNGEWKALISPSRKNILNDFMHFIERNLQPDSPSDLVEFSFDNGLVLEVPGDWNTQDERLIFYTGKVWYKNEFDLKKSSGKNYFLYFGAINYLAEVYLNGELIGKHKGGFTPFNFDITGKIKNGKNLLVISADNTITDDDIPTSSTDWLNYGGITREVKLVSLPGKYIENYQIQLAPDKGNEITGFVKVAGKGAGGYVSLEIPELNISVKLGYGKDQVADKIGFRTIAVQDQELLLNDEPVFLKGISIHEEALGVRGRAADLQDAIELLDLAKELNCNFVRLAHYTHNEYMVRVADSLGLLVWSEIPVYWNIKFEDEVVLKMAKTRMTEMIDRDLNRACIVFWSLGNETPKGEARNVFFRKMNDYVKEKDPTRLTTAALLFGAEEIQKVMKNYYIPSLMGKSFETWDIELDDTLASIVDVAAVNQYFGWYYSAFVSSILPVSTKKAREVMITNISRIRFHVAHGKPLIISEMGAGAKKGFMADPIDMAVFSEDYQAQVYENQIRMVTEQTGLVGLSPWILKDFRSPIRLYQGVQDYWNLKGLVSNDGEKKKAFYTLQEFYKQ